MASEPPSQDGMRLRWEFGIWAVVIGVSALLLGLVIIAFGWHDQTGLAALGVIASPIAAMVSAYFGIQSSQKAAERAAEAKSEADTRVAEAQAKEEQARKEKGEAIETLRGEVIQKLEDAAKGPQMTTEAAQGFAAKAWDDVRSTLPNE